MMAGYVYLTRMCERTRKRERKRGRERERQGYVAMISELPYAVSIKASGSDAPIPHWALVRGRKHRKVRLALPEGNGKEGERDADSLCVHIFMYICIYIYICMFYMFYMYMCSLYMCIGVALFCMCKCSRVRACSQLHTVHAQHVRLAWGISPMFPHPFWLHMHRRRDILPVPSHTAHFHLHRIHTLSPVREVTGSAISTRTIEPHPTPVTLCCV
jgi:hypothetical protein